MMNLILGLPTGILHLRCCPNWKSSRLSIHVINSWEVRIQVVIEEIRSGILSKLMRRRQHWLVLPFSMNMNRNRGITRGTIRTREQIRMKNQKLRRKVKNPLNCKNK